MNPGSNFTRPARYDRPARSLMSQTALQQWNAKDTVLHGTTHFWLLSLAEKAEQRRQHIDAEAITVCRANKRARKRLLRKAERWVGRQLKRMEAAVSAQQWRRLADLIDCFFRRHEAKYLAYVEARKSMKRKHRPHLYALEQCAQELDMFSLEFEEARLRFERKTGRPDDSKKPQDYRPITSFDIHHRARQQLVLMVLKTCFPDHCRADQYGVVGRGRDAAIDAVEHALLNPEIEFVCEADIENFYATIGEEDGLT